ncbi:hypothetical protein B0T16DRAFT_435788 [Cercophora newfieldiana]|uniref:NmrA-like domain-containing protein n=1 Tax=Cercophora newfieldiana TaxID=92897 RepID=A0AA39YAQ8_9PEZI|nr:hypothetical protein B0T16DRAFT_435788 [Cercophora newfieldiana]
MTIVAVAGGLGDFGRLIVEALLETGKHEVYVMSRKTDYSDEYTLADQLLENKIETVICAFIMDSDEVCEAELRLIRAFEMVPSPPVKRFIPSEFNVEYDAPDHVLPYREKKFHMRARQELAKTKTLEYTYIYTGMFMDYFGMPKVPTALRPLAFFIDPAYQMAVLAGTGEARMSMTFTTDAARYIAYALELNEWPRIMSTAVSTVSLKGLVVLVEKALGHGLPNVQYQDVFDMLRRFVVDLPTNLEIAEKYPERFPGGMDDVRALVADLEASVALGAYDFGRLGEHLNLAETFKGKGPEPRRIEDLIQEAWGPTAPKTYSQSYGFQEVLYNAISVAPGSPGLFLVGTAVTFSFTPSSGRQLSAYDLVPRLRNAWLQVRQQYPTIAAENRPECKVYTSPSSPAELEAWLDETFIVAPGKTWQDLYRDMVKTKYMTLYFCPEASQLFVQGEHHSLDGRGAVTLIERFFGALAAPASPHDLWRTDGSEVSRLPPRTEDLIPMDTATPGRAEQHAMELLEPMNTVSSPIFLPVPDPLPAPTMQNSTHTLKSNPKITAGISAACKAQRLSVTAAWHAAVILVTQSIQSKASSPSSSPTTEPTHAGTQFACFGNFDLRRYFPSSVSSSDTHNISNHHTILPIVISTLNPDDNTPKPFLAIAKELDTFYKTDLPASDAEVFPALPFMIRSLIPGLTAPVLQGSTPALSSLGVVDRMISGRYAGENTKGTWEVQDLWFGNTVLGPWLECFMWAWRGELVVSACYNGAFYGEGEVRGFHEGVVEVLKGGLGLGGE